MISTSAREQVAAEVEDRASILERIDNQPIVVAMASSKRNQFNFEEVFRSQNKLIVDAVCKEFVFVLEFFDLKLMQVSTIFNQIFSRVINKYLEWLAQYNSPSASAPSLRSTVAKAASSATSSGASTSGGIDVYAILLCIQLNDSYKKLMQQRNKIPVLDFYHDRVSMALWPKFTALFQMYIESVQRAQPKSFRVYSAAGVHSATTKYVNFISGVYRLADWCHSGQDMILPRLSLLK